MDIAPSLEHLLNDGTDEEAILAGYPFYWAAYILICDPDLPDKTEDHRVVSPIH